MAHPLRGRRERERRRRRRGISEPRGARRQKRAKMSKVWACVWVLRATLVPIACNLREGEKGRGGEGEGEDGGKEEQEGRRERR